MAAFVLSLAFGLSICFTYPTMHYAARRSLDQLFFRSKEGDTPHTRLLLWTAAIVGSTLLVGLSLSTVENGAIGGAMAGLVGSPGCIRRLEAALRSREKAASPSDPTETGARPRPSCHLSLHI